LLKWSTKSFAPYQCSHFGSHFGSLGQAGSLQKPISIRPNFKSKRFVREVSQ
jgi:hypothetical protein